MEIRCLAKKCFRTISMSENSMAQGVADCTQLKALLDYPAMRIAISEGGIGSVPYLMERADFSNWLHKAWTHSRLRNLKPCDIIKRHFLRSFLYDP